MNPAGAGTHGLTVAPRRRAATGVAGAAMLGALALALGAHSSGPVVIAIAAGGVVAGVALLAGPALRALARTPVAGLAIALVALVGLWVDSGLERVSHVPTSPFAGEPAGTLQRASPFPLRVLAPATTWPWRIGRTDVLLLALLALAATGGVVLLADAVRVHLGLTPTQWSPWRLINTPRRQRTRVAWRAVPGVALIAVAALLAITLTDAYVAGNALLQTLVLIAVGGGATVLMTSPLIVGSAMRLDRDKAGRAREEERQRFAAHLHDSVLQTLALVQRQAHDPAAVTRLARRQEHALRAWMAGQTELASETVVAALREVVTAVEEEYEMSVELTAIGDRPLDRRGEALVAAAREALRNAGRHAPGAAVYVFGEIDGGSAEVFVRDEGPGFDPDGVPYERRGLRDAVIGRMASVGGRAVIESAPGSGTEIALLLALDGSSH